MIALTEYIKSLDGVTTKYHRYGGIEFRVNNKEICHMHGDGLVDLILNKELKSQLIHTEGVEVHHVNENSNMISYQLTKDPDLNMIKNVVKNAWDALRLSAV